MDNIFNGMGGKRSKPSNRLNKKKKPKKRITQQPTESSTSVKKTRKIEQQNTPLRGAKKQSKQNAINNEYNKQRKRLQQIKRRAEQEGYIFENNPIPSIPKKITEASIRKLKRITPEQLRSKGYHLDTETGVISTSKEYQLEKKQRQKELREKRKAEKENALKPQQEFEDKPSLEDEQNKTKEYYKDTPYEKIDNKHYVDDNGTIINEEDLKDIQSYDFEESDEVYTSFSSHVIQEYRTYLTTLPPIFQDPLTKFLDNLLSRYSEDEVAQGLEQMPEDIWDIYSRMTYTYEEAIREYTQLLLDFIPNMDEDDPEYVLNGVPLTKQIMKENVDFLVNHNIEELEYVL